MSETRKLEERKHRRSNYPLQGEVYVKGCTVYKVAAFNVTDDAVMFTTTNDVIQSFGQMPRLEIRKRGFYLCPIQLQEPAVQVFELDENFTTSSLNKLHKYRLDNHKLFNKLGLDLIMLDIVQNMTREYTPPQVQIEQFPELKNKKFNVLIPFYCLTKQEFKARFRGMIHSKIGYQYNYHYNNGIQYTKWPLFYVPPRYI
jgi:hypothetical protein